MPEVTLTLACGSYDRIDPIRLGLVKAENIALGVETIDDPRVLFDRLMTSGDFDVAEMSSAEYITQVSSGDSPFVALPVFTSRVFRHSFICCNRTSNISTPKDLEGKRIGLPLYSMSAAIWCRGLLRDEYNVDLSQVTWIEGSMDQPGTHGVARDPSRSARARIEANRSSHSLSELLERGDIDATLGALMPANFGNSPRIHRLFPNFRKVEREYYERTRIHPIMHLIVLRKESYQKAPWIAQSLFKMFGVAKHNALRRMAYTGAPKAMLPFLHAEVEETFQIFGEDPWPDGVLANRPTLEKAIDYMLDDGLIGRRPSLDELFLPCS